MKQVPERQEKHLRTKENWYPTKDGAVRASFLQLFTSKDPERQWRVCIWGGDDFGMERDFKSRVDALTVFRGLRDHVTQKELHEAGFQRA